MLKWPNGLNISIGMNASSASDVPHSIATVVIDTNVV